MLLADAAQRLKSSDASDSFDPQHEAPGNPIQAAYIDPNLELAIDRSTRAAFGANAVLDRQAGSRLRFRIGRRPVKSGYLNNVPTADYLRELRRIPALEEQGDGIRSFVGLTLTILAAKQRILLIDEPEAFLHPPQARLLGRQIAENLTSDRQAFVATHSKDVILGILDAKVPVTIVRLTREGEINNGRMLDRDMIESVWQDAFLRHSNLLDGLFHDAVVVCEGDVDCRYYAAVTETLLLQRRAKAPEEDAVRDPDILWVSSSGKSKMGAMVNALTPLGIPVFAIPDFDVLRDDKEWIALSEALGMANAYDVADLRAVRDEMRSSSVPDKEALRKKFNQELAAVGSHPSDSELERLRDIFKPSSDWTLVKRYGVAHLAESMEAAMRLVDVGRRHRLFIVHEGELESWEKLPGKRLKGARWFDQVSKAGLLQAPSQSIRDFLSKILEVIDKNPSVESGQAAKFGVQGVVQAGGAELGEQPVGTVHVDGVPAADGDVAESGGQVGFPDADGAEDQDVVAAVDEPERGRAVQSSGSRDRHHAGLHRPWPA